MSETREPASVTLGENGTADAAAPSASVTRYSAEQVRRARELLTRLYAARRAARFYPLDHPGTQEALDALVAVCRTYHGEDVDVHLTFVDGEILLGEQLLPEESVAFDQLVRDVNGVGAGSLVVKRSATHAEIAFALSLLAAEPAAVEAAGGVVAALRAEGVEGVEMAPVLSATRLEGHSDDSDEAARAVYSVAISLLRDVDRLVRSDRAMPASKVGGVVRSLVDNVLANRASMLQIAGLKSHDEYTYYHSANVAILSLALGSTISADYRFLASLGTGALLHDIGKMAVDLAILNKQGPLTPEEWAVMRGHPVYGAQMLARLPGADTSATVVILEHHMRYDGLGYPTRTPQRSQHLASRIVAVADSYDAMTSARSYSAARVQDEAMTMLAKSAGTALDPALVRLFVRMLGVYPPRSVVRLSDGRVAIVLAPSDDPLRPLVLAIAAADGGFVDPYRIDLTAESSVGVLACIDPKSLNVEVEDFI